MRVLLINGSPKGERSNTMRLTRAFLEGAGWGDAERVEVSSAGISACTGCFCCWNQTPGVCAIADDMRGILPKMTAADVIVWSFPLYYFGVPGGLKNLIDRQLPLNLPFMASDSETGGHPARYDTTHQRHVVISTCGFWTTSGNYDGVTAMFDHFCGEGRYTPIFCGQGELFRVPEVRGRTDAYLASVRQAGAEYAGGGIQPETAAVLAEPLFPRDAFETMADASWETGERQSEAPDDEALRFTTQMAALYTPDGQTRVVELHYTDIAKTYQMLLDEHSSQVVEDCHRPYTTRIETPFTVWRAIARGEISGPEAMFQNQYKVFGDFDLMLRWDELFGGQSAAPAPTKRAAGKTNMSVLLAPWMAIWVVMALHPTAGAVLGVLVAAGLPLLWLIRKPVIFERISAVAVAALSLLALLGVPSGMIVPLSYGLFGVMWLTGSCTRLPLTAHYSAGAYGGDKALQNPLFVRTNRILTALWGALYLLSSAWTYLLMGTGIAPYTGLINSLCPALMGVFTLWFQRWYPAHWARRRTG